MIVRWRKDQNYYIVRLYQDLVGDWIVSQCWGHCSFDEDASSSHTVVDSFNAAQQLVRQINEQQRISGYVEIPRTEEQINLNFE